MKPFTRLLSFEEALRTALDRIVPVSESETVTLDESNGRVIAQDVVSEADVPPFDRAAMDGYAVIAADTFGASESSPKRLKLVGRLQAGEFSQIPIGLGECVQVATGSALPPGSDAVVMAEHAECVDELVEVSRPIHPGGNVSRKGEDIGKGQKVLSGGEVITPSKIGAISALGIPRIEVYKRPTAAVLPTGNEIVPIGCRPAAGQVYDVNSHTIAAVVRENGGEPVLFPPIPDERAALLEALGRALAYDILVFSGGSSVGERDLVNEVFAERGEVLFHGVQIKPGKPTLFAVIQERPVFSMPGHPTSCLSSAYLFLVPCLRKLARLPTRRETRLKARMAKRVACTLGRKQFLTVRLQDGLVTPAFKESSAITSMSSADGYIVVPENVEFIEKGEEVEVILFI